MASMEEKHAKNKAIKTWKHEDIDQSIFQNEVQNKIKVKEVKQKISQKPVAHSYFATYEQQSRAFQKKAKEIKRERNRRQGNNPSSSDDNDDNDDNNNNKNSNKSSEPYSGNFKAPPISKATKKKRKRLAKKKETEHKKYANKYKKEEEEKEEEEEDGSNNKNKDISSSDSSEDNIPRVRYGNNMKTQGGRSKFGGIKAMKDRNKKHIKKRKETTSTEEEEEESDDDDTESEESSSPPPQRKRKKRGNDDDDDGGKKMENEDGKKSGNDRRKQKENDDDDDEYGVKGVELEFKEREIIFCEMLPKPDGVLCGGETVMYYIDNRGREYFYLATDDDEDVIGVLEYDVLNKRWNKFVDYPNNFTPDLHGNCINIKNKTLYIFDRKQFGILDLMTKEWEIRGGDRMRINSDTESKVVAIEYDPNMNDSDSINKMAVNRTLKYGGMSPEASNLGLLGIQSVYIPSPIDEIHIFARTKIPPGSYHLILDERTKYIKLEGFGRDELMRGHKLVYSEGANKLIVCGGQKQDEFGGNWIDSDSIWICDINNRYQVYGYNWRELKKCKLPFGGKTFGIICGYKSILIVIYLRDNEKKEIYCLDLLENENNYKFIKSTQKFPFNGDCEYTDIIKTNDNMIHCMYFGLYGHCKLSLSKIIPIQLKNKYKQRFIISIKGYIRQNIDKKILPETLIIAISKYLSELC